MASTTRQTRQPSSSKQRSGQNTLTSPTFSDAVKVNGVSSKTTNGNNSPSSKISYKAMLDTAKPAKPTVPNPAVSTKNGNQNPNGKQNAKNTNGAQKAGTNGQSNNGNGKSFGSNASSNRSGNNAGRNGKADSKSSVASSAIGKQTANNVKKSNNGPQYVKKNQNTTNAGKNENGSGQLPSKKDAFIKVRKNSEAGEDGWETVGSKNTQNSTNKNINGSNNNTNNNKSKSQQKGNGKQPNAKNGETSKRGSNNTNNSANTKNAKRAPSNASSAYSNTKGKNKDRQGDSSDAQWRKVADNSKKPQEKKATIAAGIVSPTGSKVQATAAGANKAKKTTSTRNKPSITGLIDQESNDEALLALQADLEEHLPGTTSCEEDLSHSDLDDHTTMLQFGSRNPNGPLISSMAAGKDPFRYAAQNNNVGEQGSLTGDKAMDLLSLHQQNSRPDVMGTSTANAGGPSNYLYPLSSPDNYSAEEKPTVANIGNNFAYPNAANAYTTNYPNAGTFPGWASHPRLSPTGVDTDMLRNFSMEASPRSSPFTHGVNSTAGAFPKNIAKRNLPFNPNPRSSSGSRRPKDLDLTSSLESGSNHANAYTSPAYATSKDQAYASPAFANSKDGDNVPSFPSSRRGAGDQSEEEKVLRREAIRQLASAGGPAVFPSILFSLMFGMCLI